MNNTLIIWSGNDLGFFEFLDSKSLKNIRPYYKKIKHPLLFKILKKIGMISFFYNDWKNKVDKYNTVIMFDNGYDRRISRYIKKKNPNIKTILWLWNKVNNNHLNNFNENSIDEVWTYVKADAIKYNLKYNKQFYSINTPIIDNNILFDISFLGLNKGRKDSILSFEKQLKQFDINTNFLIIDNPKDIIKYNEYLKLVYESKAILDIVNDNNQGLTLRVMESIFLRKKLITNNKDLLNCDFYNKNNIFIIDYDNIDDIYNFINSPYMDIDEKIIKSYDFNSWLDRFGGDGSEL